MTPGDILWPAVFAYAVWEASKQVTAWRVVRFPASQPSVGATAKDLADLTARVENLEIAGVLKPQRSAR